MFKNPILVIDGNNLAYRCHSALSDLTDQVGNMTGCIYGTLKTLKTYVKTYSPQEIIICWDGGLSEWRTELFPHYKAIRRSRDFDTPEQQYNYEQYLSQLEWLKDILSLHPVRCLNFRKCEADDLISYVVEMYKVDQPKVIISSDHDFWQCIKSNVVVWSPTREKYITRDFLDEYLGVTPREYLIVRAFAGDNTDEIPGFPRIGEKTGAKIVKYIRSLGQDSENLSSYLTDEAFKYYSTKKTLQVIEKDLLRKNFILMNLEYALIYLREKHSSGLDIGLGKDLQFNESKIREQFLKKGMNNFLTNFIDYSIPWKSLIR